LTEEERATAEAHVADCGRCQALLAGLSAAEESALAPVVAAPGSRRWLAWSAPLAAAAVLLLSAALWVSMPRSPQPESTVTQRAAREEAPVPDRVPDAGARPSAPAEQPLVGGVPQRSKPAPAPQDRAISRDSADPSGAGAALQRDEPAASKSAEPAKTPRAPDSLEERVMVAPSSSPAPPPEAPQAVSGARLVASASEASIEIRSPDPSVRWRVRGSTLERTVDGGAAWTAVPIGPGSVLIAGTSPSSAVCWIVGRDGTVLVTADGISWARRALTPPADLVGVTASNATSASVTTADGRIFATADGGATWTAVPQR
jgi:hypothetical protein